MDNDTYLRDKYHQHADDIELYISASNHSSDAAESLSQYLEALKA